MNDDDATCTVRFTAEASAGRGRGRVWLNGRDISRFCRGLFINASVMGGNEVTLDILAREGLDVTLPAKTIAHITVAPGYQLVARTDGDRVIYTSARVVQP